MTESANSLEIKFRSKLNSFSFFDWFKNPDEKKEKIALNLTTIAKRYHMEKKYIDAIRCAKESIEICLKLDGFDYQIKQNIKLLLMCLEIKNLYTNAELIKLYEYVKQIYYKIGDLENFNECCLKISTIYEKDDMINMALSELEKSVHNEFTNHKILEKKAELLIKISKYEEASHSYLKCANLCMNKNEMTNIIYARPYFLMSILAIIATKNIEKINNCNNEILKQFINSTINSLSIDGLFLTTLVKSFNNNDVDQFEKACIQYEKFEKLNQLQVKLLIISKEFFTGEPAELDCDQFSNSDKSQNDPELFDLC